MAEITDIMIGRSVIMRTDMLSNDTYKGIVIKMLYDTCQVCILLETGEVVKANWKDCRFSAKKYE